MFMQSNKKRRLDYLGNYKKKFIKNITKKSKNDNESESSEDEDDPLNLPNLLKNNENEDIYIKENHLYFHTGVNEQSVDKVKKLMRDYYNKTINLKKNNICEEITTKPLYIHIFSPGGCAYSGFSLYDFIIEYKKYIKVYTIVEGLAASAATFISIAGTKRYITPSSYMLIHQLSTFMGGNFEQLKDEFDNSKKCMDKIIEIYKAHTKITVKKIPKILKHDLNWSAEECLRNGLVDEIKLVDIFND